eukprot:11922040-Ditylum_brightwellii.AAC.1
MSYIQGSSQPETAMAVYQCARFSNEPRLSHERAVRQIIKYFSITSEREIIYKPDLLLGIQCYFDEDFAGSWSKADADNLENIMLQT